MHQIAQQRGDGPTGSFLRETIHDTVMAGVLAGGGWLGKGLGVAGMTFAGSVYGASSPNETWVERREMGALTGLLCSTCGLFGPPGIALAAGCALTRKLIQWLDAH